MYANVVFPLKLPPLTYSVPPPCPEDLVGRVVRAPLLGRLTYGVVTEVVEEGRILAELGDGRKKIKNIVSVHEHFGGRAAIRLMSWLSDYYLTPGGIALKSMFFEETLGFLSDYGGRPDPSSSESEQRCHRVGPSGPSESGKGAPAGSLSAVADCISRRVYRSFLFKAFSHGDEHVLIAGILEAVMASVRGVIVLVPEIGRIEPLSAALGEIAKERLAIVHSRLTRARRLDAIRRIISGESDIVIGTRSAVLVPARDVGFIAVAGEHSTSYKAEEGMRYHGRDVAVMRALIEGAPVLLSSISPSLESTYNTISRKYSVLRASPVWANSAPRGGAPEPIANREPRVTSVRQRPEVMIVRRPRRHDPTLSREVLRRSKGILSSGDAVLFLPPRKGYSFLSCNECGHVALCPSCRIPLVFHKTPGLTKCQRCRNQGQAPDRCSVCGGFQIVPFKSGTEKVKEFLEETLRVEARLIEKGKGSTLGPFETAGTDLVPVLVGTAQATRRLSEGSLGAVVFVDIDALLSRPHFRASERTFQEVLQASRLVRPGGTILLQTAVPALPIFRSLKNLDYEGFTREELIQREALGFPPYSRMILITVSSKGRSGEQLKKLFVAQAHSEVERLGPFEKDPPSQHYEQTFQVVLKSTRREELHAAARDFVATFGSLKGVHVSVDVDPLEV